MYRHYKMNKFLSKSQFLMSVFFFLQFVAIDNYEVLISGFQHTVLQDTKSLTFV